MFIWLISGELVSVDDETVDRVANGKGFVTDKTIGELKEYTLEWGEKIPTLNEVFDLINRRCTINVELKGPSTARPVADLIRKYVVEEGWSYDNFIISLTTMNFFPSINFFLRFRQGLFYREFPFVMPTFR